jgi:hypothetical protein
MKITILEQSCVRVKNKTICAIIAAITDGKVIIESSVSTFIGIAKCSPEDKFDKTIGHRLAFTRAETKAFKFYNKKLSESVKVHTELIEDAKTLCEKLNKQIAHNKEYITTFNKA